nr:alpha/beta hydrolase [Gloeotrichia echinulata DEX184]
MGIGDWINLLITHYSLLITHYSLLLTHYSLLITPYYWGLGHGEIASES